MEVFENGGSASLCGRAKTEVQRLCVDGRKRRFSVFVWTGENGGFRKRLRHWHWHVLKKQNGCFLIRFRWSSVDGRKRCKNASVDEKLFIRFQETENGGFRKRISVDRALMHF